ncbi:MAG: protein translocase subunit SecF [Acidaminococcales bacterium]|jgi:preprotein translocase subunit SecF|nr:protein translocase subunit SecF [Acidaminococcales bacterium]
MKIFPITEKRKIWFAISAIVVAVGLVSMFVRGFNLGIDFTGGSLLELKFTKPVTIEEIREVLRAHGLENSVIQLAGETGRADGNSTVLIRTAALDDSARKKVTDDLAAKAGAFDVLRIENVGAVLGGEITRQAVVAIALSWLLMIAYITWRFEFKFAIASIIALLQDVMAVLTFFSLFQVEIDATFVAALLTIIGYSINDTIVIFDRIRENMRTFRRSDSLTALADKSIRQTLARSIYTVLTVLFVTAALYCFGGDTTRNFSLALLVGLVFGSYTSIFCAGSFWVELNSRKLKSVK